MMFKEYHYSDTGIQANARIAQTAMETNEIDIISLYMSHRHKILAYLTSGLRNRETAEDLCQQTFIKALRNWPTQDKLINPRRGSTRLHATPHSMNCGIISGLALFRYRMKPY
ncbi:MAG: hypothetical protein GFH27_549321n62 [Chloroflexi bacterium AL-W]|nr:hypothetical protein [Chloroflexi bacterium AL-N1]NOK64940.1 hypothetical protein [Chloroflexi bacterium AL-N10]NOK76710.1 hypothetical protein [Chloroflexi bacterium AL-N5]NOK84601.1 hypothetical protein [Chloroflexi bacterium AL-W]NOK86574.1 hypothetical protein [Chloroflexi bacterium AL-N15]